MQNELAYYAGLSGLPADRSLDDHQLAYFRTQSGLGAGFSSADYERSWLSSLYGGIFLDLDTLRRHHFRTLSGLPEGLSTADYARVVFSGGGGGGDVTNPTAGTLASSNITSTTFDLTVSGAADETSLHAQPYRFSTDNGSTWSPYQTSPVFNVTGKTASTAYTCVHQTRDAAGNVATGSSIVVNTSAGGLTDGFIGPTLLSTSNIAVYTFNSVPLGTPDAARRIVLAISGRDPSTVPTSVTIDVGGGPIALTLDIYEANTTQAMLYSGIIPTGTTGTIVVTYSTSHTSCGIGVWALYNKDPVVGGNAESTNNLASPVVDVPTQVGDFVIAAVAYGVLATAPNWAFSDGTVNERYDEIVDGLTRVHAGGDKVATGTTTSMGGTVTDFNNSSVVVAQAYRTPLPFEPTFMQQAGSTADATSYTFTAQPIGAASATRLVVVGISSRLLAGGGGAGAVTIGGIAATQLAANPAATQWCEIWCAVVPTGTTADIVVPIVGGTASGCGIGVWTLPYGSPSGQVAVSNDDSASLAQTVTTLAGDVVIGVCSYRTSSSVSPWITWASGTKRYDVSFDGLVRQHSGADVKAVGASVDMGLTIANFSTDSAACAAGFRA